MYKEGGSKSLVAGICFLSSLPTISLFTPYAIYVVAFYYIVFILITLFPKVQLHEKLRRNPSGIRKRS